MHRTGEWSPSDIETLKNGFLNGMSFKLLSERLGRSTTAVNKALSRFQIRPVRTRLKKTDWAQRPRQNLFQRRFVETEKIKVMRAALRRQRPVTITPSFLLAYLQSHGYSITMCNHVINAQHGRRYMLNQRPLTLVQLLVKANSIRLDEGKPIFLLEELDEDR